MLGQCQKHVFNFLWLKAEADELDTPFKTTKIKLPSLKLTVGKLIVHFTSSGTNQTNLAKAVYQECFVQVRDRYFNLKIWREVIFFYFPVSCQWSQHKLRVQLHSTERGGEKHNNSVTRPAASAQPWGQLSIEQTGCDSEHVMS